MIKQIRLSILGSTGSVGQSVLRLVKSAPDAFDIQCLTAHSNLQRLLQQALEYRPGCVLINKESDAQLARQALSQHGIKVYNGQQMQEALNAQHDVLVNCIVGIHGLLPMVHAVPKTHYILCANKESIVCGGQLLMDYLAQHSCQLLPLDSEHNALLALMRLKQAPIEKIILLASGGVFWNENIEGRTDISLEEVCKHPKWDMGRKISIDSATMMNKALEVIEACHLFHVSPDTINVRVHEQCLIHGMISYKDKTTLALMGASSMMHAIVQGIEWCLPKVDQSVLERFYKVIPDAEPMDILSLKSLEQTRYQNTINMANTAVKAGQYACVLLDALNSIAVNHYVNQDIYFTDIVPLVERQFYGQLARYSHEQLNSFEQIVDFHQNIYLT